MFSSRQFLSRSVQIQGLKLIQQWVLIFRCEVIAKIDSCTSKFLQFARLRVGKAATIVKQVETFFRLLELFLGAGYPQQWWHSEKEEGEEGQIQSVGGRKILRSDDPFWSRHYQALNVTMDQECQQVTIEKWRTKTFSFSLSSWDQILQQR